MIITDTLSERLKLEIRGDKVVITQENKGVFPDWRTFNGVELNKDQIVRVYDFLGKKIRGEI